MKENMKEKNISSLGVEVKSITWEVELVKMEPSGFSEYFRLCTFQPVGADGNVDMNYGAFSIAGMEHEFFEVGKRYFLELSAKGKRGK